MEPVLELKNINYAYHTLDGETAALTNITFSVSSGEFVAIVGPFRAAANPHCCLSFPDLFRQKRALSK